MNALSGVKDRFRSSEQGFLFRLTALAVVIALIVLAAGVAFAAELVTAELESTGNEVSVAQGTTENFTISVSATGNIECGSTATATVDTSYSLTKVGSAAPVLAASVPSAPLSFTGSEDNPAGGSGNCAVRWAGWPNAIAVPASITVGSNVPVADYTQSLGLAAGTTTVDNTGVTTTSGGGRLQDATSTTLKFKVTAPTNTAPSISATNASVTVNEGTPAANSGTWSDNGDVTLSASRGTVTKNLGGNAGTWSWSETPGNETVPAGQTVTITATDGPGLTASASFTLIVNNVAPTTPGIPSVPAASNPSSTGAYTVSWNASDDVPADTITYSLEHKKGAGDWSTVVSNLSATSYTFGGDNATEGEGSWKYRVRATDGTDASGYSDESASVVVDKTGPSIEVAAVDEDDRELAVGDWASSDVTVTFTCVDADSGVDASATNVTGGGTFTSSGTATSGGTCVDNAGNSVASSGFPTFDVNIDRTAPSIVATATKAAGGTYSAGSWTNGDVSITFACTNDSGGAPLGTSSVSAAATTVTTTTASPSASSSGACVDEAGNAATEGSFGAVNIDRTAPSIVATATKAAGGTYSAGSWTNGDVSITFACTNDSGGAPLGTSSVSAAATTVTTTTASPSASSSGACVDEAGNAATEGSFGAVNIDRHDPTIVASGVTADGNAYTSGEWTNQDVTVGYVCDDLGGSGLASSCPLADEVTTQTGTDGEDVAASISDNAGNRKTSNIVNVKIDKTGPTVTCPVAPSFELNAGGSLTVVASVTDGLSGPRSLTASGAVDTSTLGTFTSEVTGYDNAENSSTVFCSYVVKARFTGWSSPINNPNYLNKMKAGQAVPFKWRLTDANGVGITTLTSSDVKVSVGGLACISSVPVDGVEEFAAGSSGLQNLGDGYYQVNWKSLSSYAGSCRRVTFDIRGASNHEAQFQFTK